MRISLVLALALALSLAAVSGEQPKPTIDELAWLAGCWEWPRGARTVSEQWMKPAGGTMMGMSRTVAGGKTVEFEFLQMRQRDDGDIVFLAKPSGQHEAVFRLVTLNGEKAIFENAQHDFPQRIIYHRQGDALIARIEGVSKGKQRSVDYPYLRIKCD